MIKGLKEGPVGERAVSGRVDSPAERSKVSRVREEEVADRVRHRRDDEQRPRPLRIFSLTGSVGFAGVHNTDCRRGCRRE